MESLCGVPVASSVVARLSPANNRRRKNNASSESTTPTTRCLHRSNSHRTASCSFSSQNGSFQRRLSENKVSNFNESKLQYQQHRLSGGRRRKNSLKVYSSLPSFGSAQWLVEQGALSAVAAGAFLFRDRIKALVGGSNKSPSPLPSQRRRQQRDELELDHQQRLRYLQLWNIEEVEERVRRHQRKTPRGPPDEFNRGLLALPRIPPTNKLARNREPLLRHRLGR